MTQIISLNTFWNRYGNCDLENTDFMVALNNLPSIGKSGPWLAGGAVRRFVARENCDSDFDFFFKNEEQKNEFVNALKERNAEFKYQNQFNSTWELKIQNNDVEKILKVQVIYFRFFETPEELISFFDFSICQFVFDGENIICGDFSLFDLANRRLVPENISYATSSVRRMLKYARQGFTVCDGCIARILQLVAENPNIINADVRYID